MRSVRLGTSIVVVALASALAAGCNVLSGLSDLKVGEAGSAGTTTTGGSAGTSSTAGTGGSAGTASGGSAGTTASGGSAGTTASGGTGGSMMPTCSDGQQNGDETDMDCGGSCSPCKLDQNCKKGSDCESELCDNRCVSVTQLAAGNAHACGLLSNGKLLCWGSDNHGQVGDGTPMKSAPPTVVADGLAVSRVVANGPTDDLSAGHTCIVTQGDGKVYCWGWNVHGQLGNGKTMDLPAPPATPILTGALGIAAGGAFTCAIQSNGTVACWGTDLNGELADGGGNDSPSPKTTVLASAESLTAGSRHACVRFNDGGVDCWGSNARYQIASVMSGALQPQAVDVMGALSVHAGGDTSCARTSANLICWGDNSDSQLTSAVLPDRTATPQTLMVNSASSVAVGADGDTDMSNDPLGGHVCAVLPGGSVSCWGNNRHGQLGRGTTTEKEGQPAAINGLSGATQVVSGSEFSCAILGTGAVKCWGRNDLGQLGAAMPSDSQSTPVSVVWP